jgi:hypothetical protein
MPGGWVTDKSNRIPGLSRLCRKSRQAIAYIDHLCPETGDDRRGDSEVVGVSLPAAVFPEPEEIQHDDGLSVVLLQEAIECVFDERKHTNLGSGSLTGSA